MNIFIDENQRKTHYWFISFCDRKKVIYNCTNCLLIFIYVVIIIYSWQQWSSWVHSDRICIKKKGVGFQCNEKEYLPVYIFWKHVCYFYVMPTDKQLVIRNMTQHCMWPLGRVFIACGICSFLFLSIIN